MPNELLKLIITADTKGAVSDIEKLGKTSTTELAKAEKGIDKFGAGLTKAGAISVGAGALILTGLGKAAMASEEADKATLRLQNSMANNPKLAGETAKSFTDLATSIMHKTAADDDAIVSGEAVLAQMGLTADQIRQLTPLVVDVSRKMGVDMDTAAKTVAKSVNGSAGALQKMGIHVDATRIKTDAFGATVDALSQSVGGFAEQEGQTFAGSLERLKNELHNVEEGVGKGAVQAFSNMFGVVEKVTGALERMNPGTQAAIGQFATYAATGLIVVGAIAAVTGKLITLRDRFTTVTGEGQNATRSLTGMGKALTGLAVVGTIASLYETGKAMNHVNFDAQELARTSTNVLVKSFLELSRAGDLFGVSFEQRFKDLAEQSYGTAVRIRDGFAAAGESTKELDSILQSEAASQRQANADTQDGADALDGQTTATDKAVDGWKEYKDAIDQAESSLKTMLGVVESHEEAVIGQARAQAQMTEVLNDGKATWYDQLAAVKQLADENVALAGQQDNAAASAQIQIATLQQVLATIQSGSALYNAIVAYIAQLKSIPSNITTTITTIAKVSGGGGSGYVPGYGGAQASGGDYMVNKPTMFLAGEAGPERATFTPLGTTPGKSTGSGGGGRTYTIVQHIAAGASPAEVGRQTVLAIKEYERAAGRSWRNN